MLDWQKARKAKGPSRYRWSLSIQTQEASRLVIHIPAPMGFRKHLNGNATV